MRGNPLRGGLAALLGSLAVLAIVGAGEAAVPVTDGLLVQLDASVGVTQEATTGFYGNPRVSAWADQAALGGANNATQGTDAARPEYYASVPELANQPALHFFGSGYPSDASRPDDPDGQYDLMELGDLAGHFTSGGATVFVAAVSELSLPGNPSHFVSAVLYPTANNDSWWKFAEGSGYMGTFRNARKDGFPAAGMAVSGAHVFEVTSGATYDYYEDGSLVGTTNADFNGGAWHRIGGWSTAQREKAFEGYVAEVLVYDRPLTDDERNQVGYYLQDKYGLQGEYEFIPTEVIPEPATMLLLGVGVLGALRRRR